MPFLVYLPDTGSAIRRIGFLRHLSAKFEVTLVGNYYKETQANHLYLAESLSCHLHALPHLSQPGLTADKGPDHAPKLVARLFSTALRDTLRSLLSQDHFDLVQLEHSCFAESLPDNVDVDRVYVDEHNIESEIRSRQLQIAGASSDRQRTEFEAELERIQRYEEAVWKRFPRCIVTSLHDRELLVSRKPEVRVEVVPNCVDTQYFSSSEAECNLPKLLFIGNLNHPPNVDAVLFFCRSILPLLVKRFPDIRLQVIGGPVSSELVAELCQTKCEPFVHLVGYVKDARSWIRSACVMAVPIRSGSGTRLKILTAMAMGIPVVTTSVGVEGIEAISEEQLLVRDEPNAFADAIADLLQNPSLRRRLCRDSRHLVHERYSYDAMKSYIDSVLGSLFPHVFSKHYDSREE